MGTPLHRACARGDTRAALALIESNADLEADKETPLHVASGGGHCEIVAALIKSNADIEAINNNGETPLCHAIVNNSAIQTLIKFNANINHHARYGWTPLRVACQYKNLPALKALLAAGAKHTSPNPSDHELVWVYSRTPEIVQTLADAAAPWSPDRHFLRGFPARSAIKTLLLCAQRTYLPAWPVVMVHIN